MKVSVEVDTDTGLPVFPADRDARCPFDPSPDYREWRETGGLRKVNWQGHEVWAVSRYWGNHPTPPGDRGRHEVRLTPPATQETAR